MSDEKLYPRPDDILEYRCPKFGIVWQWRVHSVHLGGLKQEDLIEVSPVMAIEGDTHKGRAETVWVPAPMTRDLKIFRVAQKEPTDE